MKRGFIRGFIRGLWGIYGDANRIIRRRKIIDADIKFVLSNSNSPPSIVYVYGTDNFCLLKEKGFNCVLINDNPAPFDLITETYRHKLEILRYAMEEDGYDEIIFIDWDCRAQKALPNDFWEILGKKEAFQANLQTYCRRKAYWRKKDKRKIPNAGFVYIRDKSYPSRIIKYWENHKGYSAEPPMARLTDELTGGWQGIERYWDLFEANFCNLRKSSSYSKELLATKDVCFIHCHGK